MNDIPSEMLRGHIDTIILLCLLDADKHTAQIKEEIEKRAGGDFELKQGTFYSCLQRIVKQGYVTEYRTSNTPDGVRRKFYQLTEKGKIYIDENKDKWEYSRQMINTLILTPEKEAENNQSPTDDTTFDEKPSEDDMLSEQSLKEFLSSIGSGDDEKRPEEEKIEEKPEEKPVQKFEQPTNNHKKQSATADNYDLFSLMDNTQSDFFADREEDKSVEFALAKEQIEQEEKNKEELIKNQEAEDVKPVEPQPKPEPVKVEPQPIVEQPAPIEPQPEPEPVETKKQAPFVQPDPGKRDDLYNPDTPVTTDYKTVLSHIFNTAVEEKEEKSPRQVDYTEGFDINTFFSSETIDERAERSEQNKQDKKKHKKPVKHTETKSREKERSYEREYEQSEENYTTVRHPYYDFSDIQGMADNEGFKVKISSSERVRDSGRIFINKLIFHSSLIFFLILATEALVLYFTTAKTAGLEFLPFGIFIGFIAVFPLFATINYAIYPNKRVSKISTFKSSIELLAIIMLNLILIVIVCCVLSNINFADQTAVMRFIVYPTFFVLNLPVYLFIKYLKLDKDKYFE